MTGAFIAGLLIGLIVGSISTLVVMCCCIIQKKGSKENHQGS